MFSSLLKGRLMKKLTVLLMAGAIVAIALPAEAGPKNSALLACSEGSHSDDAKPYAPGVDSCQASGGAGVVACAESACGPFVSFLENQLPCTACLDRLRAAGCKRKAVDFSCVGPLDRARVDTSSSTTNGIVCVKNFVFECPGIDDDDDDD